MSSNTSSAIPKIVLPHGGYKKLLVYRKSEVVYQGTVAFCRRFLPAYGDRTVDQMVQAARSCKQNIAEGSVDGITSREMELKLTNVSKASMHELRLDYEDYLLTRRLTKWAVDDPRTRQTRSYTLTHMQPQDYQHVVDTRSDETAANIAITMLHQFDVLITRLIEAQKQRFLDEGGIKEQMYRARMQSRGGYPNYGNQGSQKNQSTPSDQSTPSSPSSPKEND
jgi:four helix bundle suffix protein